MSYIKELRVVGVTFRSNYPDNLLRVKNIIENDLLGEIGWSGESVEAGPIEVVLQRDPENKYDENAIQVIVPVLGRQGFVGFVPAEVAVRLAPKMDAGLEVCAEVVNVYVTDGKPNQPGLEIRLTANVESMKESV